MVRVARLLLAKLGGFVLPSVDSAGEEDLEDDAEEYDKDEVMEKSGAMMCLYLHKRDDQPAHEVVQKVLRCGERWFQVNFFFVWTVVEIVCFYPTNLTNPASSCINS